jgi:hypothetical protein
MRTSQGCFCLFVFNQHSTTGDLHRFLFGSEKGRFCLGRGGAEGDPGGHLSTATSESWASWEGDSFGSWPYIPPTEMHIRSAVLQAHCLSLGCRIPPPGVSEVPWISGQSYNEFSNTDSRELFFSCDFCPCQSVRSAGAVPWGPIGQWKRLTGFSTSSEASRFLSRVRESLADLGVCEHLGCVAENWMAKKVSLRGHGWGSVLKS